MRRERLADALGLLALELALLDYLRPGLLLLSTITAGGDTPCHYPTAAFFADYLLPRLRLHGWYAGGYLGHPLLLYYFPLPFGIMAALAPLVGLPAAFKLGTVGGVFLMPLFAYASLRLMRLPFPAPLLGAAAAWVFLFCEENPIWGGTMASTLAGEFSYTYGTGLALLFLGVLVHAHHRGGSPWRPAAVLAVTALAHGYAVLWAGLSAGALLYGARRPLRTLGYLIAVGALGFALSAYFLLPLMHDWRWTTPYDDPWITVIGRNVFPPLLWPLLALGGATVLAGVLLQRRAGGWPLPLVLGVHSSLVAAALAAAGPALGIVDVRFLPFAQLAASLLGAAALGCALSQLRAPALPALGLVLLGIAWGDSQSQVLRYWIDWNFTGLEAKERFERFSQVAQAVHGGVGDPRVAVEYSTEHERAGSIRMYETLPFFSGRPTLEGVYNQASLSTHPVYYLASELGERSPNPFQKREYSDFDTPAALDHLRLFDVADVVALSAKLQASLAARDDVELVFRRPPYEVFRIKGGGTGYVEPLRYAPVRSSPKDFRDAGYRWFQRKMKPPVHLVFTDDPRFTVVERDPFLPPPEVPLPAGVEVKEKVGPESVEIETNRIGHPLLVKISWHPRWHAIGAAGPYLVSPSLMLIVPEQNHVSLVYQGRDASDYLGYALALLALAGAGVHLAWRKPRPAALDDAPLRLSSAWTGLLPFGFLLFLTAARLHSHAPPPPDPHPLFEKATRAQAERRFEDAAEFARHALARKPDAELEARLLLLRGECLLEAGEAQQSLDILHTLLGKDRRGPQAAHALYVQSHAHERLDQSLSAQATRSRLLREFPESPWAKRVREEFPIP